MPEIDVMLPLGTPLPGKVVAWGYNNAGQATGPPAALSGVSAIGAGADHTLAVIGTPTVDFGNKILGAASTAKTFTLRNTGTGPLAITGASTTGGNSGDFTVNTSLMSPPIFAGGEGVVIVTFNPTTTGPAPPPCASSATTPTKPSRTSSSPAASSPPWKTSGRSTSAASRTPAPAPTSTTTNAMAP